jgi:hypothetical protein
MLSSHSNHIYFGQSPFNVECALGHYCRKVQSLCAELSKPSQPAKDKEASTGSYTHHSSITSHLRLYIQLRNRVLSQYPATSNLPYSPEQPGNRNSQHHTTSHLHHDHYPPTQQPPLTMCTETLWMYSCGHYHIDPKKNYCQDAVRSGYACNSMGQVRRGVESHPQFATMCASCRDMYSQGRAYPPPGRRNAISGGRR